MNLRDLPARLTMWLERAHPEVPTEMTVAPHSNAALLRGLEASQDPNAHELRDAARAARRKGQGEVDVS